MENFNKLTPGETERLAMLMEEMAEASQIIGKTIRHGYRSHHPDDPETSNQSLLSTEIGHVRYMVGVMVASGDLSGFIMQAAAEEKALRVGKYLHHNTFGGLNDANP